MGHIDTKVIVPLYEGSCMVYNHEGYQKQKHCPIPVPYLVSKKVNSSSWIPKWYERKTIIDNTSTHFLLWHVAKCG